MFTRKPAPTPTTVEDLHNSAHASSAYAAGIFHDVVLALEDANTSFDAVVDRANAEVARLTALAESAMAQRLRNTNVITNVNALLGDNA